MSHLAENILSAARIMPEGGLLSPKEFLHLGSRAAIDKNLSRLAQEGKLLRVSRGAYVAPHQGRFGSRPPFTESVVQAIEASSGETVVANGAAEANALGPTTQVSTREVFLTSGASRILHLGTGLFVAAALRQCRSGQTLGYLRRTAALQRFRRQPTNS